MQTIRDHPSPNAPVNAQAPVQSAPPSPAIAARALADRSIDCRPKGETKCRALNFTAPITCCAADDLLTLFALGILLIDLMLPAEWKWMNAVTALVGVVFRSLRVWRIQSQFNAQGATMASRVS